MRRIQKKNKEDTIREVSKAYKRKGKGDERKILGKKEGKSNPNGRI